MTKSNTAPSAIATMFKQTQELMGFNPMLGPQIEHFWQAQENILSETERFARHWFERRHAATLTALDTARNVTKCGASDPAAAVKAVSDWQAHSLERIAEDVGEWLDLFAQCTAHMSRAEAEAGAEGLDAANRTMKAAAATKEAVPV